MSLLGIHHVTAFAGHPQGNLDFFTKVLGLRFIKQTVNFDDNEHYHLYYADRLGTPGTVMTYFAHPGAKRAEPACGQIDTVRFAVPAGSADAWAARLEQRNVAFDRVGSSPQAVLRLTDPDGLPLELHERDLAIERFEPWLESKGHAEMAITGFAGVRMAVQDLEPSRSFLTRILGLVHDESSDPTEDGEGAILRVPMDDRKTRIELRKDSTRGRGRFGPGTVHHIAWRVADEAALVSWRARLSAENVNVTDVRERKYFRSIYFREPGGIVFEIATDGPGFTADETVDNLGGSLQLPSWLEDRRAEIAPNLPRLTV